MRLHRRARTSLRHTALSLSLCLSALSAVTASAQTLSTLQRDFVTPPDDARIMMRWWWFGPAVAKPELEREILAMKAGGIGGFEIQPVYPMALDDATKNFRNLPYLSKDFLDAVTFTSQVAQRNGMRVDMTLASGWPYGGPHVSADEASARLRLVAFDLPAGAASLAMPTMVNGESLIASYIGDGTAQSYDAAAVKQIAFAALNGRAAVAPEQRQRVVVFAIESRTAQQVKRAAVGAEGFVLDHFSRAAIDHHLQVVGEPLMKAFGDTPPYAVFSDSLEVYAADWTDDLLTEFQRRRGYDLKPYLPLLGNGNSETAAEVRHDWGVTLTELVNERYLTPLNDWATAHHTRFRSQTYGFPSVSMSSNRLVALPEGEGPQWDRFSFTRWASSASHLYGRPVTSAETWTWLHSPAFRATPLDMKAEADRFFLEGVNQLIGHGWPYTPAYVAEPGWAFYAAAVFNDHNPWWIVMPDVTTYLQRMSYLMRQGKPVADVAILLPDDDAYAAFVPGKVGVSEHMPKYVTPELMQQVLSSGYAVDFIDAEAIEKLGIPYAALVLPHVERLSPETMKAIDAYARKGGKVIAVGTTPSKAPGLTNAATVATDIQGLATALFARHDEAQVVADDAHVGIALRSMTKPDLQLSSDAAAIGFVHRATADADIYFLANTSNHAVKTTAQFRSQRKAISVWDPFSGKMFAAAAPVELNLAPYESSVVIFSDVAPAVTPQTAGSSARVLADLSGGWKITFPASSKLEPQTMQHLVSWTDNASTRFFSGVATYTKTLHLDAKDFTGAKALVLDFGEGTPVTLDPKIKSGMRALLESPVREAAVVIVNGKRMGSVWHPPYTLDVTGALHAGDNAIELQVANTDINLLAGKQPADYSLLNARYTERFTPQDMDNLQPLPSGVLGAVHLVETH